MKKEEDCTISFHISKGKAQQFSDWCAKRMIVKERLWEMIIDDLIGGNLYDIPERYKPKINVTFNDEKENIVKTYSFELKTPLGKSRQNNRPHPKTENKE